AATSRSRRRAPGSALSGFEGRLPSRARPRVTPRVRVGCPSEVESAWHRIVKTRIWPSSRNSASACALSTSASRRSGGTFDLPALERRAAELNELAATPDLWKDAERA